METTGNEAKCLIPRLKPISMLTKHISLIYVNIDVLEHPINTTQNKAVTAKYLLCSCIGLVSYHCILACKDEDSRL